MEPVWSRAGAGPNANARAQRNSAQCSAAAPPPSFRFLSEGPRCAAPRVTPCNADGLASRPRTGPYGSPYGHGHAASLETPSSV